MRQAGTVGQHNGKVQDRQARAVLSSLVDFVLLGHPSFEWQGGKYSFKKFNPFIIATTQNHKTQTVQTSSSSDKRY